MKNYSIRLYTLHPTALESLKRSEPWRCFLAAALAWVAIYGLVRAYLWADTWWLYLPAIFLIAGRAGVFLQLAHEAAHGLVGGKRLNNWFGNWCASYPIGLDLKGYAEPHLRHHACANRACDPIGDREKYRVVTPTWELLGLFLKDACGWTAIRGRYLYANAGANREEDQAEYEEREEEYIPHYIPNKQARGVGRDRLRHLLGIAGCQLAILGLVFQASPVHYVTLWLIPLATAHMVLMRIRGIGEHGLAHQLGITMADFDAKNENGTFYTRTNGSPMWRYGFPPLVWLERALIGSLNVYLHHEHHLAPKVPYYNLPRLHRLLAAHEHANNKHVFQPGYLACLFFRG